MRQPSNSISWSHSFPTGVPSAKVASCTSTVSAARSFATFRAAGPPSASPTSCPSRLRRFRRGRVRSRRSGAVLRRCRHRRRIRPRRRALSSAARGVAAAGALQLQAPQELFPPEAELEFEIVAPPRHRAFDPCQYSAIESHRPMRDRSPNPCESAAVSARPPVLGRHFCVAPPPRLRCPKPAGNTRRTPTRRVGEGVSERAREPTGMPRVEIDVHTELTEVACGSRLPPRTGRVQFQGGVFTNPTLPRSRPLRGAGRFSELASTP